MVRTPRPCFALDFGADDVEEALRAREVGLEFAASAGGVLNGVAFWAYLQLSWLVLARVTAVTHSVCNAMRRPAVIVAGWLQFGNEISYLNGCGIALACGGAALYGHVSRPRPPPAEERETLV